jgi:hypothetical protein
MGHKLPGCGRWRGLMDSARRTKRGGEAEMLDGATAHSPWDRRADDSAEWDVRRNWARAFHSAAQPCWYRIPET